MPLDIVPNAFWTFPGMRLSSLFDEDDDRWMMSSNPSGLSISEDENHIYVDAALPGVNPKDVELTYHKGVLRITGKANHEEKKDRKSYRTMTSEFSYQVVVPGEIDQNEEPEATTKHGVMTVTFVKSKASQPKKIAVKM
jgi:HSP20 family protein